LAVVARGVLGAIPVCGPLIAEIVGVIIPNQRVDRIVRLVELLGQKMVDLEQKLIEERLKAPEGVDLLEDGFHQAARALSEERLEYIANILRSGITEEQAKMAEKKRLMWLLGQLDDAEIILLAWYGLWPPLSQEFMAKHADILEPKPITSDSTREEIDSAAMQEARKAHLVTLALLRPRHRLPQRGQRISAEMMEGLVKPEGHDITRLGEMLLIAIGVKAPTEDS
jgi:hypothetical protein